MKQTIIKVFFLATAAITARKDGSRNIKNTVIYTSLSSI
ncbi:hypothetical protein B4153_3265 [Bacillus cereus]|uniref:Uncharacterized protein n=1 Tax=Bacillus cereus (strain AH187) TaxID=405534 RepID=B7HXQ4_BACC7|nr:hypothetical protein BCAH187_A3267 [Bacillus cereus AH187]EEK99898.1 hypothetical protein bcere0013_29610 [Bacillus cereus BDRD-ST26]KLA07264.1 hypothetical protein B4153_3265 [Bacillus cereus]KLA17578.1 hypothetical protein B4078_3003 [Bacillus cereus]KZD42908.1 hypothetical protein B4085_5565 [Bacillus cereus]